MNVPFGNSSTLNSGMSTFSPNSGGDIVPYRLNCTGNPSRPTIESLRRDLLKSVNTWSNQRMDTHVHNAKRMLLSHDEALDIFMEIYFKSILSYVAQSVVERDCELNGMIQLHVDHMSKILRASSTTTSKDNPGQMYFPQSMVAKGRAYLYRNMCERLQQDFTNPTPKRDGYYIIVSKHALANFIGKDVYTLICLAVAKSVVTEEQLMILLDMMYNGPKMASEVRKVLSDFLLRFESRLGGRSQYKSWAVRNQLDERINPDMMGKREHNKQTVGSLSASVRALTT